jgi:hypothetical protein
MTDARTDRGCSTRRTGPPSSRRRHMSASSSRSSTAKASSHGSAAPGPAISSLWPSSGGRSATGLLTLPTRSVAAGRRRAAAAVAERYGSRAAAQLSSAGVVPRRAAAHADAGGPTELVSRRKAPGEHRVRDQPDGSPHVGHALRGLYDAVCRIFAFAGRERAIRGRLRHPDGRLSVAGGRCDGRSASPSVTPRAIWVLNDARESSMRSGALQDVSCSICQAIGRVDQIGPGATGSSPCFAPPWRLAPPDVWKSERTLARGGTRSGRGEVAARRWTPKGSLRRKARLAAHDGCGDDKDASDPSKARQACLSPASPTTAKLDRLRAPDQHLGRRHHGYAANEGGFTALPPRPDTWADHQPIVGYKAVSPV